MKLKLKNLRERGDIMENNLEIFITNLDKRYIKNENSGEITNFCMVTYLIPKENTNKSKGLAQLSCYCKESAFNDLDKFMYKWTKATLTSKVDGNRLKLKIKSVNDILVS